MELLAQACLAADRAAEELQRQVDGDGPVVYAKGVTREHPCLRPELACRSFIVRTLQRLGIVEESIKPVGRPGGRLSGWTPEAQMATKRTPLNRQPKAQITAEAVRLFVRGLELQPLAKAESAANTSNTVGPLKSEYIDTWAALNRLLGIKPWQDRNPLDVGPWAKPLHTSDENWDQAQQWRADLLQAAGLEPERL